MQIAVGRTYPVLQDVLQFEGLVTELLTGHCGILGIVSQNLALHARVYLYVFVGAGAIFQSLPGDRQRRRVISRSHHLVDVPVGLQIGEVAHTRIGAHTLGVLIIPQGEGVVITVGEDDGVAFLRLSRGQGHLFL